MSTRIQRWYWLLRESMRRYRHGVLAPVLMLLNLPLERSRWSRMRAASIKANHVLLLAWHFPPATNGGVFRPLSLARYAGDHGWTIHVVSEAVPAQQWKSGAHLVERVPAHVQVTRIPDSRSRAGFDFLPDLDGGLANLTNGLGVLREVLRGGSRPSVILASGPPFFNFPLARLLSWLIDVPYVIEYRDEWSLSPHDFVQVSWLDKLAERWSLSGAAHIAFATQAKLEHCFKHYPVFDSGRATVVPNGWDPSLGNGSAVAMKTHELAKPGNSVIRLAFAGTLASHTSPGPFLETLERLLTAEPVWRDRVQVEFIGHKQPEQQAMLTRFPYPGVVYATGLLSQNDARARMAVADILLVFNPSDMLRYLPGKLLEYLAVPRPVLLYGAGGEMESLLRRAHSGIAVREDDPGALGRALEDLVQWHEAGNPERLAVVHSLRRDVIAARYFHLLSSVHSRPAHA